MKLTRRQTNNLCQLAYDLVEARTPPPDSPPIAPTGMEDRERMEARGMRDALDALRIAHETVAVTDGYRRGVKTIEFPWPGRDVPEPEAGECVPSEAECRALERLWAANADDEAMRKAAGDFTGASLANAYGTGILLTLGSVGIARRLTDGGRRLEVARAACNCEPGFMTMGREVS